MSALRSFGAVLASGLAVVLAYTALMAGGTPVAGAVARGPSLQLVAKTAPHQHGAIMLVATLERPAKRTSAGPVPLAGYQVSFSVHVEQFSGAPLLALGSAATDAAGEATLTYRPTWTGSQALVATATSPGGSTLGPATASFTALSASHPFAGTVEASRPDGVIGRWVAGVLLGVLAILWVTLVGVVVRAHLALGSRSGPEGGPGRRARG